MIKNIITVLLIVLIAVASTVIFYWKDSRFDPASTDLLIYLLVLPVLISAVILTPWLIYHFYQTRKQQQNQPEQQAASEPSQDLPVEIQWLKLKIFSAFSKSALGENHEIIPAIQKFQSPQLDTKLVNRFGEPILSYRISALDEQVGNEDERFASLSVRQQRITALILQQIEEQRPYLHQIADHLRRSSLFFETEHLHEYRMHPAWIDPQAEYDADDASTTQSANPVSRLNRLNLHMILSEDLLHRWDDQICSEHLHELLGSLGFLPNKLYIEYHFWAEASTSVEWLNLLQQVAQQQEQVSLILYADSEIDQELIDERSWVSEPIAAEFAGSCCVSAIDGRVEDLHPIKQFSLALNQPKMATILHQLDLKELQQFQSDQPFVVVPDHVSDLKMLKQLNHQFDQTPIETYHYLTTSSSLGYSQHLARIYGYVLAMQFPEDQTVFVVSAQSATHPPAVIQAMPLLVNEQEVEAS